ncbi:hypothetical protein [Variovorax sp.]|uniref:hypothetical protein n=1 Tax=Variovorax sp. TaxID=1871043 RepID=UPI003BAA2928
MLGNRTVVFGMPQDDGKALSFTPETDSVIRPRVASKNEISEQNILDTLKAAGFALKQAEPSDNGVDLEMTGDSGEKVVVEVKVRDGVPSRRELELVEQELRRLAAHESSSELWRFSRDELQLDVYALVDGKVQHERLVPLNVWEATREGIFERSKVLERVSDWERRLRALYDEISRWTADSNSVTTEQSRTVTMSEELMRNFAVPDRELPILDIARGDEPIASLVPRALWIIGANGRVDLITKSGTRILVDVCEEPWGWKLVDLEDRRKMLTFDKAALWALLGGV